MSHTIDPNAVATMQGRELDALIAEHLFGWRVGDISSKRRAPAPALMGKLSEPKNGPDKWLVCPHYTTDHAAFFAMVEAVRAKGWAMQIDWWPGGHASVDLVPVKDDQPDESRRPVRGEGSTLTLAFARAALQACLMDTKREDNRS